MGIDLMKLDRVFKRIKTGIAICGSGFLIRKNNLIGLIQMSDIVLSKMYEIYKD